MACTTTGKGRGRKITSKRSTAYLNKVASGSINPRQRRQAASAAGAKRRKSTKVKSRARRAK